MWVLLIIGIILILFGLYLAVIAAKDYESDPSWRGWVLTGVAFIAFGISLVSAFSYNIGKQADPPPANHQSEHVEPLELPNPVK